MLSMGKSICVIRGHMSTFLQYDVFIPLKIVFIFPNSSDPVEMPTTYTAFHIGLHLFTSNAISRVKRVIFMLCN